MITKTDILLSLLCDNRHRCFTVDELRSFLRCYSVQAVKDVIYRARKRNCDIRHKNGGYTLDTRTEDI